jgi:hypothetical protein
MSTGRTGYLSRAAEELERDGVCVLRGVFDPNVIHEWRRAFDRLAEARRSTPGTLAERGTNRFYLTLPWCAPFADEQVFRHPVIAAVLERIFGAEYVMVQLAVDTALPGSDYQDLHRDHAPLFSETFVTPLYALAVNFPLCPVTRANGPFEMVRGTHRAPRGEALARTVSDSSLIEPVLLDVGDVVIRTPLALHRGSPNQTLEPRPMVVMGYVRPWLNTPNVGLTVPRPVHDRFSADARRLLRCSVVDALPPPSAESYLQFQY